MKKIIGLIALLIVFSCSTSSDGNGNSTTTVVPIVPTNLTGEIVNNQVKLNWNDGSTNESGFKIDRKEGTGSWSVNFASVATDIETYTDAAVTAGSTYTYRVYSYNAVGPSLGYSNTITVTIPTAVTFATLTTTAVSGITTTAAATGGTITNDGGAPIIARGVVWSNLPNPTIDLPTKTTDGSGIGTFSSIISGLNPNWDYHVRAYATNSAGTAYGNEITFTTLQIPPINIPGPNVTDIDGNIYASVTNCGLTFTKENLNVSKYTDGTPIPQVTDPVQWRNLTTGAWCYFNNDPANGAVYGKLYNWYAVAGIYDAASASNTALRKKLAPTGWHVPSDGEWSFLINCLDPNANGGNTIPNFAGGKMKATGTIQAGTGLWQDPNTGANNESGLTGLPAGSRYDNGTFTSTGLITVWWHSSEFNTSKAWCHPLDYINFSASRSNENKKIGFSARCVKD
jgi:uncharacterized protein (TIGR02145 family)